MKQKPWSPFFWKRRLRRRDIKRVCRGVYYSGLIDWSCTHVEFKNGTVWCSRVKNKPIMKNGRYL